MNASIIDKKFIFDRKRVATKEIWRDLELAATLPQILRICLFQVSRLSRVPPHYLVCSVHEMMMLLLFMRLGKVSFLEKYSSFVVVKFNVSQSTLAIEDVNLFLKVFV